MMTSLDHISNESMLPRQSPVDDAPPVDAISLQTLVQEAAEGRRSAAWHLLHWLKENDSRVIAIVDELDDERLAQHLLEWIALGTWAGKPFVAPASLHSPTAKMHLYNVFLPRIGVDSSRVERLLIVTLHNDQPALRQTAAHILGLRGKATAVSSLVETLHDPVHAVQIQAVKALGHIKSAAAIPALLSCLKHADEHLGNQIFTSLAQIGPAAVPALIEMSTDGSEWVRWHCIRALGEVGDIRVLPVLVQALADTNHSVAWMSAKKLVSFGRLGVGPVLRLLMFTEVTPWLVETAYYVLNSQPDARLTPYIEPVLQEMHEISFRLGTMLAAQKALTQLIDAGLEEEHMIHPFS